MDIVCVTETRLSVRDANSCTSTIPGYTLEHIPRCNRSGGGVGVFFKDGLRLASSKPWPADSFECMEVVFNGLTASSALRLFVIIPATIVWTLRDVLFHLLGGVQRPCRLRFHATDWPSVTRRLQCDVWQRGQ